MSTKDKISTDIKVDYIDLSTKSLVPHPIAQRNFVGSHGNEIADNFNWVLYEPICVSFRDGIYWIIDGQHRHYGIKKRFGDRPVKCKVFTGMTVKEEIQFFLEQNKGRKNVSIGDKLRVLLNSHDSEIESMVNTLETTGWTVNNFYMEKARWKIAAYSMLLKAWRQLSTEQFVDMFKVLGGAWNGDPDAVNREILNGMIRFYKTYWNEFNSRTLVQSLTKVSPLDIKRDGRPYGNSSQTSDVPYARAILRQYNNNKRNRLEDRF